MRKIYKMLVFLLKYNGIKHLTDDRLISLFRKRIHSLENQLVRENISLISTIYNRKVYFEANKRNLLSEDEVGWANRVLFGINKLQNSNDFCDINEKSFFSIIKNRRSIRKFKNVDLEIGVFKKLIDAARWAPSSCNRQPWEFIIINDKEIKEKIANFRGQKFVKEAPYCILVIMNKMYYNYDDEKLVSYYLNLDAGAAVQNILLMAEYLNISTCWVNLAENNLSSYERKKLYNLLSIPEYFELNTVIPLGYSDFKPIAPGRKELETIIYYNKFYK